MCLRSFARWQWLFVVGVLLGLASVARADTVAAGVSHTVVVTPVGQVWSFGSNSSGQLGDGTTTARTVPTLVTGVTDVTAVAAGSNHTVALLSDGTVVTWGYNAFGQLGDGTTTGRTTPVPVVGLTEVVAIAAGAYHSLALRANGSVWAWGSNSEGQLGDGTTTQASQPVYVGGAGTANAIAAGHSHSLAVRTDGSVWAWGRNTYGQLGDSSTTRRLVPVPMTGVSAATAVAAGEHHSLVRRSDGAVYASGGNFYGQLGDGTWTARSTPVLLSLTGVTGVAAGYWHSAAVREDGTLWAWGYNGHGQLGDGTTTMRQAPVGPILSGVSRVAGYYHTIAVSAAGEVRTWGSNGQGQLGDGTMVGRTVPSPISDSAYAWWVSTPTFNVAGGTYTTNRTVVIAAATPGAEIRYTLTGEDPTLADPLIASGGAVLIDQTRVLKARAWKVGMPASPLAAATYTMQVATVTLSPYAGTYTTPQTVSLATSTPGASIRVTTDGSTPTESSALYTTPFGVATSTTVKAAGFKPNWTPSGANTGTYTMRFGTLAAPVVSPAAGVYMSGATVTLSAMEGATVRYTVDGATPHAASPLYTGPVEVTTSRTVKAIALHPDYTTSPVTTATYTIEVAAPTLTPGGGVYPADHPITVATATPGATLRYTLTGLDPTENDPVIPSGGALVVGDYTLKVRGWKAGCSPGAVTTSAYGVDGTATLGRVAAGSAHGVALRPDGVVWAWGANSYGQLGDGTTATRWLPALVAGLTGARAIAAGDQHSLALVADGTVRAWGSGGSGRLGDGGTTNRALPVTVTGLTTVVAVAAGGSHSVALTAAGTVWSWGSNVSGQLGDGSVTTRLTPVPVAGLSDIEAIAAGQSFTMALSRDGRVWTWGSNTNGQLGDGTTVSRIVPTPVPGLTGMVAIAAGGYHALAIAGDGVVWGWGYNGYGQLGDGTTTARLTPVAVASLAGVTRLVAGGTHSLALDGSGQAWAWGGNASGQLGDGTLTNRLVPTAVVAPAELAGAAAGGSGSLAVSADGVVWSWGFNTHGQVGDGTTVTRPTPVAISGTGFAWRVSTPVLSLPAGRYETAQTVTVSCADPQAVLRYTTTGLDPTETDLVVTQGAALPIDVSLTLKVSGWKGGAPTSVVAAATYELQVVAPTITPGTGAYPAPPAVTLTTPTPGATYTYTLDGAEPTSASTPFVGPFLVARSATVKATAFKAGWTPSAATVVSYWVEEDTVATPALGPPGGVFNQPLVVTAATTTPGATLRYTLDGTAPTTRSAVYLEPLLISRTTTVTVGAFRGGWAPSTLVNGTYTLPASGPAPPTIWPQGGRFATWQTVTVTGPAGATLRYTTSGADPTESDAVIASGATLQVDRALVVKVRSWQAAQAPSPVTRAAFLITGALAAGRGHSLALAADGTLQAWGHNYYGQLGDGGSQDRLTPAPILTGVVAVATGDFHSLALLTDGTVRAWGANTYGQLGDGTTVLRRVPVAVLGLTGVVALAAGSEHSLALRADGTVWAWGRNTDGQLGDDSTTHRTAPVAVAGLRGAVAVTAGGQSSLAIVADAAAAGVVWAWGRNSSGQLGDGTTIGRRVPVRLAIPDDVTHAAMGGDWAMAGTTGGRLVTWGSNSTGQLGDGDTVARAVPRVLPSAPTLRVGVAGAGHALALDPHGRLWGWGDGAAGQLAEATTTCVGSPCAVPGLILGAEAALAAAGGLGHSLVLSPDGRVLATGANGAGQLGDGTRTGRAALTPVGGLTLVSNAGLLADPDGDGLASWKEFVLGTDPWQADSNGNGLGDGDEWWQGSPTHPDPDGDGVATVVEVAMGTDPLVADTDGDGVSDGLDAFPLDPTRHAALAPTPGDTTPPVITVTAPASVRPR